MSRWGWAVISAALLGLGWAVAYPFAWLGAMAFVAALEGASPRQLLYVGLLVGVGQSAVLSGIAQAGLTLYLAVALSYGLAAVLFAWLQAALLPGAPRWGRPWIVASAWVVVEWLHAQVPYAATHHLGDSQTGGPFLPLARVGGTYAVGFVIVAMAAAAVQVVRTRRWQPLAPVVGVWLVALGWSWAAAVAPAQPQPLSVVAVQGGIPTWAYARAEEPGPWAQVPTATYTALTQQAPPAELTVWPETAVWQVWGESSAYEDHLRQLQRQRGGGLLVGLPRKDAALAYANAAVLLTAAEPPQFADKRRLALLAEVSFSPGVKPGVLRLPRPQGREPVKLGVVFCLETVTPRYVREAVQEGAQVMVVLAEGGRFGHTPVGEIHADHSVVRAVEAGRSLLHAGQHGFTTVIDPHGRRSRPLPPYTAALLSEQLALYGGETPFVRWGAWVVAVATTVSLLSAARGLWLLRRRRRATQKRAA